MRKLDVKLYRGYVNNERLVVFGHAFKSWAPDKYRIDLKGFWNALAVMNRFRIRPLKNQTVILHFKGVEVITKTMDDGYFQFDIPFHQPLESGWHTYKITCEIDDFGIIGKGELLKPYPSKYAVISDIDDTFLVSHSKNFFKKLYIILFKNVYKRKVFKDVTPHYQALSKSGQTKEEGSNSFFYVSSSEWNLYDFIVEFTRIQMLPKAVLQLKDIKTGLGDFLFTGRGNHDHKFEKIKDLISFYPDLQYVLLGDDTQQDPAIYERICKMFEMNIEAVYIRQTGSRKKSAVTTMLNNIEDLNVPVCYFKESDQAIKHSLKIGVL